MAFRGSADVAAVLRCCKEQRVALTVRGGGHSVAGRLSPEIPCCTFLTSWQGTCIRDGAVLLDLSSCCNVLVDPVTKLVHVGGGATWSDVDRETLPYSLSVPAGLISHTGVGGLTLGGGIGFLARQAGLSCDSLESALIVTANGEPYKLSAKSEGKEAELWWALRGGGQGLGVVMQFVFAPLALKEVYVMRFEFPIGVTDTRPRAILKAYQTATVLLPRQVSMFGFVVNGAMLFEAVGTIPFEQWGGGVQVLMNEDPGRVLKRTSSMAAQNCAYDDHNGSGKCYRWSRSTFLSADADLQKMWSLAIAPVLKDAALFGLTITVEFMHLGGKISDLADDASAFRNRAAPLETHAILSWATDKQDTESAPAAARVAHKFGQFFGCHSVLHLTDAIQLVAPLGVGSYNNTDGTDQTAEERATAVYGPHLARLRAAKAFADPTNLLASPYGAPQVVQGVTEAGIPKEQGAAINPTALRAFHVRKRQAKPAGKKTP